MKMLRTLLFACVVLPAVAACGQPDDIVTPGNARMDGGQTYGSGNLTSAVIVPTQREQGGGGPRTGTNTTTAASGETAADSTSGEDGGHTFSGGN